MQRLRSLFLVLGAVQQEWEESKKILNLLADTVNTVTPFLVEGMLNVQDGGEAVRWLTPGKIMRRKLLSFFHKRDVFSPLGL